MAVEDTVPHGALTYAPGSAVEHDTLQVTPAFVGSFVTLAVACKVMPGWSEAVAGVTVTVSEPDGPGRVMAPAADFVGSAIDVAVIVALTAVAGAEAGGL